MKPIKKRIVEPIDDPGIEVLVENQLADAGWPRSDARWLAVQCLAVLRSPSAGPFDSDPACDLNLQLVARAWKDSGSLGSRDRALLITYARLIACGGKGAQLAQRVTSNDRPTSPHAPIVDHAQLARAFRSHDANFEDALVSGGWPGDYSADAPLDGSRSEYMRGIIPPREEVPKVHRLMRTLAADPSFDLTKVIDMSSLVGIGSRRYGPDPEVPLRVPTQIDRTEAPSTDPRSLVTWMIALGPEALNCLLPQFRLQAKEEYLAAMAFGIQDAIERWLFFASGHWSYFGHAGSQLADATQPFMEELERRSGVDGAHRGKLRKAWLWFAHCTSEAAPERITPECRERILRAANEDLAALRPLFARANLKPARAYASGEGHGLLTPDSARVAWEDFEWEREHFETCVVLLYQLGGVWRGMKPLLLALRAMACPCVASDLRYWNEQRPPRPGAQPDELAQPPEPWSFVPASMINLFHAFVGNEQKDDPELEELRGHLAAFCLRGLADRWKADKRSEAESSGKQRSNEDMLERSPDWRLCLIRAAMALNINPEGKGHRILDTASRLDPELEVRAVAHEAYEKLRRAKGLPEDVSPRRAVMTALWWIRQAHLLALDFDIDADGAQRTRVKELTRTKDQERAEHQRLDTNHN